MTTKKKTQKGEEDKPRGLFDKSEDPQNALTLGEVGDIAGWLHACIIWDANNEGLAKKLLILLHSLAAEPSWQTRANMYDRVARWFMPDITEADDAMRLALTNALEDFRKGGAR
jgi:hypothetical protein